MNRKLIILSSVLLFACSSNIKTIDVEKVVDIPANWSTIVQSLPENISLWREDFNDSELIKVIEEAFEHNYSLKAASANVTAATSQAKMAGAPLLPQASASFNSAKTKSNLIGMPFPNAPDVLSIENTTYGTSLNLSWELDLWGKLSADHASALAGVQMAAADLYGAKLSLEGQISKAWFTAIEAKKQLELARKTLDIVKSSTEQVRLRYSTGLTRSLDLRLSLSNLAITEANLKQRELLYKNTLRQIEILLGRYPSAELEISDGLPEISVSVPAGIPADIISRRPDLVRAERALAAANAGIKRAKGALYPQINLTGSKGATAKEFKDILKGDYGIWSLGANIMQPIFQRGRLKAGVDLAKQNSEMSKNVYLQSVLTAFGEVEGALSNSAFLSEREELIKTAVDQAVAARELAEDQYSNGLIKFITMLEAQRSAYENESQLLMVKRERLTARIDLYLALGGDFNYMPENKEISNGVKDNE